MPRPTPKDNKRATSQSAHYEPVSPIWLIKAICLTIVAALLCGYLTFCLLFYQGQWQLVLHPVRTSSPPASIAGIPYELLHFGPDESATPQLTGWWIPSEPGSRYAHNTILFLPHGDGSLLDAIPTLAGLHSLGLNILAFDYRGFGQSAPTRPNQQNMTADADAAWKYLTTSRAIPDRQIVPYGTGVGASLATYLANAHHEIPALILDTPRTDLLKAAQQDPRSRLIPVSLLFHERFPLASPLSTLTTPKLLLSRTSSPAESFRTAAAPRLTVEIPSPSESSFNQSVSRFLDQYLPPEPAPELMPSPAPAR